MARIFISYRRADNAAGYSRSLAKALRRAFGDDAVFRDIRSIPPGVDFPAFIESELADCEVMLVLIGTHWLDLADAAGRRRLANPDDWVRREVGAGIARNCLVIPVLVCGARIPSRDELPDDLKPLAAKNAFTMSDDDWEHDLRQLVDALVAHLGVAAQPVAQREDESSGSDRLADTLRRIVERRAQRKPAGLARRIGNRLVGWVRLALFAGLIVWIGYTQNDAFAAGVDRFFSRSAEMLANLAPW